MKRYDENLEVSVFKYDIMKPLDWGEDIENELRGQVALWNRLCEIEKEYVARVRAVADPASAILDEQINPLVERFEKAVETRRAKRKQAKKKLPTPELDLEIDALHTRIKELRETVKTTRKQAYADNKDTLTGYELERRARVKDAYQNSGLFWANYNAVIASYDRSRGRALSAGRELHPRQYNGEGRLTNQIQGGMTVGRLLAGTHSQAALGDKPAWLRAAHHLKSGTTKEKRGYTLKVNVFTSKNEDTGKRERRTVSFPFIMYRPLPEDAMIKEVVVTRRKHADTFRYAVIFTLTQAKQNLDQPVGMPVAINLGWRKMADGLRVATAVRIKNRSRLKPLFEDPSHTNISDNLMHGFEQYEAVQSERDNARNLVVTELKTIETPPNIIPEALTSFWTTLFESNRISNGFLIKLYHVWLRECPAWNRLVFISLRDWYQGAGKGQDPNWKARLSLPSERVRMFGEKGISREQANRRRWLNDARLYFYRLEARRLVGDASLVVINSHNMAETAKKDSGLPPPARRQRFLAAPSVLRQAIINYCKKHNIEVEVYKGPGRIHWQCQNEFNPALPDELQQLCTHCHVYFDSDVNFCQTMLTRTFAPQHAQEAA